jgi:hypothetical protein
LFEIYDFQLKSITTQKLSEHEFSITATAVNRGILSSNVWLRIYPVVGGGISEFPIAEFKITEFLSGQSVSLPVNYTTPNLEQVEIYAKIDDGDKIPELSEKNNSKIVLLTGPLSVEELKKEMEWKVYPNPFDNQVKFEYTLQSKAKKVTMTIYTQNGSEVLSLTNCPVSEGMHSIDWVTVNLADGNYIYRFNIETAEGKKTEIPGILVKTGK